MPTRKPDVVNEHRITLGRWEREQIKHVKTAATIGLVGTGVGIAAVGIGGTYVAYKIGNAIYEWGDDAVDWVKDQVKAANPVQIITGLQPLDPDAPNVGDRDDGWIFGGPPTILQVAWENTFN
jgi:hypothetical protein